MTNFEMIMATSNAEWYELTSLADAMEVLQTEALRFMVNIHKEITGEVLDGER